MSVRLDDALVKEAARRLAADLGASHVYLFGSRARGDASADSDYDFFVIVPSEGGRRLRLTQQAYRALSGLDFSKDIIVTTRDRFERRRLLKSSLEHEVATEGLLVHGR
ncbi:MAG: nucleotidyltransferase domain-containing protein [Armatimonadetes bacterium]|nr:nucleotidyltransferase domain-containing protein [Armatimonadota bacterium]